jgi:DNA replication and repair protein RecF
MQANELRDTDGETSPSVRHGARRVCLQSFRNYDALELNLSPGFNVISGPNAQGKTNFLESLYLLATTRLLRGQRDAEAILEGGDVAKVSGELLTTNTEISVTLHKGLRKRAAINGLNLPRASDLIGRLPAVSVSTVDLAIVRGEPADRRMFLDLELSGLHPSYLRHLTMYKRALEQRNALLKDSREMMQPVSAFEPWETQLAHHGAAIRHARNLYIWSLAPLAKEAHSEMSSGEGLHLAYVLRDEAEMEEAMLTALSNTRSHDIARGSTGVGPHRDDVQIDVGGRDGRLFGSQGQQRTSVIAVKLAAMEHAKEQLGGPPLLLLDDIFSDLDAKRRELLVERVGALRGQAVLTCTEAESAGRALLNEASVFRVLNGRIEPA